VPVPKHTISINFPASCSHAFRAKTHTVSQGGICRRVLQHAEAIQAIPEAKPKAMDVVKAWDFTYLASKSNWFQSLFIDAIYECIYIYIYDIVTYAVLLKKWFTSA
jgi:hypothetical protein